MCPAFSYSYLHSDSVHLLVKSIVYSQHSYTIQYYTEEYTRSTYATRLECTLLYTSINKYENWRQCPKRPKKFRKIEVLKNIHFSHREKKHSIPEGLSKITCTIPIESKQNSVQRWPRNVHYSYRDGKSIKEGQIHFSDNDTLKAV